MSKKKKITTTALIAALIILAIIALAVAATIYLTQLPPKPAAGINVGVKVGDTFNYQLMGQTVSIAPDASIPAGLSQNLLDYNNTKNYRVIITDISGTVISYNVLWQFINGTVNSSTGSINIATGAYTGAFWALYPANLNKNNLLNPHGNDELIVNSTSTQTYTSSDRKTNYWSTENVYSNSNETTGAVQVANFIGLFFDKQTGMLVELTNEQQYSSSTNTAEYNIITAMQLTSTTDWNV